MYKFTADGQHLGKGITWRKGQSVPPGMPIDDMLKTGAIVPEPTKAHKTYYNVLYDYTNLSYKELGELMEERGLEFERSTEDRISRLIEADEGGDND